MSAFLVMSLEGPYENIFVRMRWDMLHCIIDIIALYHRYHCIGCVWKCFSCRHLTRERFLVHAMEHFKSCVYYNSASVLVNRNGITCYFVTLTRQNNVKCNKFTLLYKRSSHGRSRKEAYHRFFAARWVLGMHTVTNVLVGEIIYDAYY